MQYNANAAESNLSWYSNFVQYVIVLTHNLSSIEKDINKLFEIYRLNTLEEKNAAAVKTLNFIAERLKIVTKELDSAEINIENFFQR